MVTVEIVERIDRPVEAVFDRLIDIDRYPEWMPDSSILITCSRDTDGPVRVGTRYTDRTRLGTVHGEVVELERPGRVVFHYTARLLGRTVMEGWPGYTLEAVGTDATRLRHSARARLYGPLRLLRPVVQRMARRERGATVAGLKALLEATAP